MLITDESPVLSARSLPIELIETVAEKIRLGYNKAKTTKYERIHKVSPLEELVFADLTYGIKNCIWYNNYYSELENICNISKVVIIPHVEIKATEITQSELFFKNPLNIHSPMYDEYYYEMYNSNRDKYNNTNNIYTLSRLFLVDMNPSFNDFVMGTPVWLVNSSNELIKVYDKINRRHIKIVRDENRLRYYTSIISDNWTEIMNVPPEIDTIVKYLISNRANLDLTNES